MFMCTRVRAWGEDVQSGGEKTYREGFGICAVLNE
jgi:hypothetical protein